MTTHDPDPGGAGAARGSSRVTLEPEREPRREPMHAVVAGLGWLGFVWLWWDVVVETSGAEVLRAVLLVVVLLLVVVPVNLGWVAHNVAIFRRKGPRTGLPSVSLDYEQDWTGRRVVADDAAVRDARLVEVDVVDEVKTLRPVELRDAADQTPSRVAAA